MSNIVTYINRYGNLTFDELKYNELDSLILAVISYIDFDGILENNKYEKIYLKDAAKMFFERYSKKELMDNVYGVTSAIKLFEYIKDEKRYQDMKLYNYSYKRDSNKQFSALFIDIDDKTTYISFEGTDDLISGWKEDFQMTYVFPVPAQREAIKYINKSVSMLSKRHYILGGHSKGGNLALVAGMFANPFIKSKILKIISYDGPGLKQRELESKHYKSIESKLELIVPNYSLIGVLLRHKKPFTVISSTKSGPMSHNIMFWETNNNKFVRSELSKTSKDYEAIVEKWLNTYSDEERKRLITQLFDVFKRAKIDSLTDIKVTNISLILSLIEESKKLDEEAKSMLKTLVNFFLNYLKTDKPRLFKHRVKE